MFSQEIFQNKGFYIQVWALFTSEPRLNVLVLEKEPWKFFLSLSGKEQIRIAEEKRSIEIGADLMSIPTVQCHLAA